MAVKRWIARALGLTIVVVLTSGHGVQTQKLQVGLSATASDVVRLAPDTPTATSSFLVTDAAAVVFDAVATAANVRMAVVSPSGARFDEANIGTINGTARRGFVQPKSLGPLVSPTDTPGDHITFTIPNPAQGTWTVELGAPAGNTDEIAVVVTAILDTTSVASIVTLPGRVVLGDAVSLNLAAFSSDQPITGAAVQAQIVAPGGGVTDLALVDNGVLPDRTGGDGLYAAAFIPQETGRFDVLAVMTGVSPTTGASLRREAATTFDVVQPTLALLGAATARGVDLNFNGLFDQLMLDIGVKVLQAGAFVVQVDLEASNGTRLSRGGRFDLTTSDAVVHVTFTAEDIRGFGVDGPYRIGPIEIAFLGPLGAQPADRLDDGGNTPPFTLGQFEQPAIRFAGTSRDSGIDLNANQLFDRLDVELDMIFVSQGFYQWSAILFDADGTQIGFATGNGVRPAGVGTIGLSFAGAAIGANGANGPYTVGNFLVTGAGRSLLMLQVAETAPYTARQFEGFVGNAPPVAQAHAAESIECTGHAGTPVKLDGSASSDPDGDALTFEWRDGNGIVIGSEVIVTVSLGLGKHSLTLTVDDGNGGTDSTTVSVSIVDTIAPAIAETLATPNVIWPATHAMHAIQVGVKVNDACTAAPVCRITSVSSNEPQDASGDGSTSPDWLITGDLTASVRGERLGGGSGRIYSLKVTCTDSADNQSSSQANVSVPHDQR
jgi:PKD domain